MILSKACVAEFRRETRRVIDELFGPSGHPQFRHLIFHKDGSIELDLSNPDVQKMILEKCSVIEKIRHSSGR